MADFGPQDYGRMGLSFANWRNMTGMDKNPFPMQQQSSGVAPPTIGQQFETEKSQMAAIPGAFGKLMQGDFAGASNAFQPQKPIQAPVAPVVQPVTSPIANDNSTQESSLLDQIWGTK